MEENANIIEGFTYDENARLTSDSCARVEKIDNDVVTFDKGRKSLSSHMASIRTISRGNTLSCKEFAQKYNLESGSKCQWL